MNDRSTDPRESEEPDENLRRALASIQSEPVPPGPPANLMAMTLNSLWYPFRSATVKDICDHLTPEESGRLKAFSRKFGALFGLALSAVLYPLAWYLSLSTPVLASLREGRVWPMFLMLAIMMAVVGPIGWIAAAPLRRRTRQMLCESAYAKRLGITPESLSLYDFTNIRGISASALFVTLVLAVPIAAGGLLLGALGVFDRHVLPPPGEREAREILERMSQTYAECRTYRDSGLVTTQIVGDDGQTFTVERKFQTAFVRPDRFRFEFAQDASGEPIRYIIWTRGSDIRTWGDAQPKIEQPASRELAWGGAAGISSGSSNNIPPLLWPERASGAKLVQITEPRCAEDGTLDGAECFRVQGHSGGSLIMIWIDKQSSLVRRIDEEFLMKDRRVHLKATYTPVLNEPIADELLEFDPPVSP